MDKDLTRSKFLQVTIVNLVVAFLLLAPMVQALAEREELLRSGKLTTILFVRDFNSKVREMIR